MKIRPTVLAFALATALTSSAALAAPVANVAQRIKALHALIDEQWQHTLKNTPEFATMLGDLRYNDRWSDLSPGHAEQEYAQSREFLRRFETIDPTGMNDEDRLNRRLMIRNLKDSLTAHELHMDEMPLEQMSGVHLQTAGFIPAIPFGNAKQYQDYIKRLQALPKLFEQAVETARKGMQDGMMPPKYLLEKVLAQIEDIAKAKGENSPFATPLKQFPKSIAAADQARLRKQILSTIDKQVIPAYRKLATFVAKDYAPHGRSEPGVWALPNGDAIYRFAIHQQTTTDMSPEEIHRLGLAEVARTESEMLAVAKSQGYHDLPSFRKTLASNPKTYASSREDILDHYRKYIAQMQPELPKLFGLLPKTQV